MRKFFTLLKNNKSGFTLMELVVTISLLIITVGVTGDIILTLVRSYTKNQVATEVEQSGNFVFLKLEKELRGASGVTVTNGNNTLTFVDSTGNTISYVYVPAASPNPAYLRRNTIDLVQTSGLGGITVTCNGQCFTNNVSANGSQSIQLNFTFSQAGGAGQPVSFTVANTIVPRGNY